MAQSLNELIESLNKTDMTWYCLNKSNSILEAHTDLYFHSFTKPQVLALAEIHKENARKLVKISKLMNPPTTESNESKS